MFSFKKISLVWVSRDFNLASLPVPKMNKKYWVLVVSLGTSYFKDSTLSWSETY